MVAPKVILGTKCLKKKNTANKKEGGAQDSVHSAPGCSCFL